MSLKDDPCLHVLSLQAPAGTGVSREAVSGLLIMGAGGGSLIVLSILLLRRKKPYGAISHGVVEVRDTDMLWGGVPEPGHGGAVRPVVRSLCPATPPLPPLQVDPMLTLEEQQLRELQRHGYENPTYRFLEERP